MPALLALVMGCSMTWAAADDLAAQSLEELLATPVTGAAKRAQAPKDAPSMVSVVTADEIRRFGWRRLDQALDALRGVHITYDRSYAYIGVRGFGRPGDYNSRVLMLIDGIPINDGVYDQAPVGNDFPLDLALVERIEYVPGAGSALYGGNAFLGVINVVTRRAAGLGTEVEAVAGSGREAGLRVSHGHRDEVGNDWLVGASREARRGRDLRFDAYAVPGADPWSRGLDHEDNSRIVVRYGRGGVSAALIAGERGKGLPGGPYGADLDDPRNGQRERRVLASVEFERQVDPVWSWAAQAFAGSYEYAGTWAYGGVPEPDALDNRWVGGEARFKATLPAGPTVVGGFAWRRDGTRHQFNRSLEVNTPRRASGLFMQGDWALSEALLLSLGARSDRHDDGRRQFSPRLAIIARPQAGTTLKLISGRAFRPANAYESDYAFAGSNLANRELRAERIASDEIGVERRFGPHLHLAGSAYRYRIRDLVAIESDPATLMQQHHNVGGALGRGVEVEATARWREHALRASVARQDVRHESGAAIANSPRLVARLMLSTVLDGGQRLAWESHHLGRRTADSGSVRIAGAEIGGHTVSHLTWSSAPADGWSWQLRVANLFDRRHAHVAGTEFSAAYPARMLEPMPTIEQDRRSFQVRLERRM